VGAQLDAEALKNGTVSLIHARGIFDDGMVFHMPECDPLPEPRNIADLFPAVRDTVTIMLAVAPRRPEGANTMTPGDAATLSQATLSQAGGQNGGLRFRAEIQMLHDETTGRDEKPVHIGRKNIKLLLDTEAAGDLVTLPIARIMRDGSGHFIFDESFIPPSVEISASERLMSILGRLI
jgi:type VI secretion system protein ImpJ